MSKKSTGTMTFTSPTAVALWNCEISGQISDGTWENSRPTNHWQFWCRLDVKLGAENEVNVTDEGRYSCRKNDYALIKLHQMKFDDGTYVLRNRMFAYGRMAKAGADPTDYDLCRAGEYMPKTLDEFNAQRASGKYEHDFIAKYMSRVTQELAERFYASTYTLKEMNEDLNLIMSVMRSVETSW